ncbi:unnamed protein product [Cladocopium goreaui]|uniref:PH domain-containing protein n=1 Tax=Cladocopium goreaui TaxID=2562237 RepID=A0A9P1CA36_9DINO|nr:unnamed protein product [Cladocopium goreaui]
MSSQELRRQLESLQEATVASPQLFEASEIDEEMGKAALISRLQASEEARLQETRGRELAEAKCALVEQRCRDAVARLEAELLEARAGQMDPTSSGYGAGKDPTVNGESSSPLKEEVQALTEQMDFERKVHDHRRALLERYRLPGKVEMVDRFEDGQLPCYQEPKPLPEVPVNKSSIARSFEAPRSTMATDDEDYNWEGYLERPSHDGSFEKVFVEIRNGQFQVLHNRGSQSLLSGYPLSSMAGAATITSRCARSFEVEWPGKTESFRCVSERRAAQWVEAINSAWHHAAPKSRITGRRVKA